MVAGSNFLRRDVDRLNGFLDSPHHLAQACHGGVGVVLELSEGALEIA